MNVSDVLRVGREGGLTWDGELGCAKQGGKEFGSQAVEFAGMLVS